MGGSKEAKRRRAGKSYRTYMKLVGLTEKRRKTNAEAFAAGSDCAVNGASEENSHFSYFATKLLTEAWQLGKRLCEEDMKTEKRHYILYDSRCHFEVDDERSNILCSIGEQSNRDAAVAEARSSFAGQNAALWSYNVAVSEDGASFLNKERYEGAIDD